MEGLNGVLDGGTVGLAEDVRADLHDVIGPQTDEVVVEGLLVKIAEGQAVGNDRPHPPARNPARYGRIKKSLMAQPAEGALTAVGFEDPLAEGVLMQADTGQAGDVGAMAAHRIWLSPP